MKTQQIKIQVPEPCHEDWNKMTPKDKGAFCSSCEKVVVDFTKMSDRQLVDFLDKNKGKKTCGKFNSFQVDRKISVTIPPPNYYWKLKQLFVGMFVSLSFPAFAKGIEAPTNLKPLVSFDDSDINKENIKGVVKDYYGNPISHAYVRIYQNGRITKSYAVTDETGKFSLELPQNFKEKSIELRVTAQDFVSESVIYNGEESLEIVLAYAKQILGKMAFHPIEVEEPEDIQGQSIVSEIKTPCQLPPEVKTTQMVEPVIHIKGDIAVEESEPILMEPQEVEEIIKEYEMMGDVIVEHPVNNLPENITGTVVDEYGYPIPFANVYIENAEIGAITNLDGNFNFKIPPILQAKESIILKVAYIGYEDQTVIVSGNDAVENKVILKVALIGPRHVTMGIMISVPIEELDKPSSFDKNYQVPEWEDAGYNSRREWKEATK